MAGSATTATGRRAATSAPSSISLELGRADAGHVVGVHVNVLATFPVR